MSFETIRVETDARGVATLTLARAEKHNALSSLMITEIARAARALGADEAVRVVVLTGEGKSFCAGADLGWMQEQIAADRATRMAEARKLADMLNIINTLPKPVIGALQGNAFGGGVGMASVCDIAIGAKGIRFGLTEVRLGLIPATISPYVLARMGEACARRVFFSARLFDAEEAVALGLLARAVAPEDLSEAVEAEVAPFLSGAPTAIAASKALARSLGPVIDEATIDRTIEALADTWETEEASAGIAAFFAKEKAPWIA